MAALIALVTLTIAKPLPALEIQTKRPEFEVSYGYWEPMEPGMVYYGFQSISLLNGICEWVPWVPHMTHITSLNVEDDEYW